MIEINQLRLMPAHSRIAQPDRWRSPRRAAVAVTVGLIVRASCRTSLSNQ